MLSPPPCAWRILQLFRSHGRRELSHSRRSGAWSRSESRYDTRQSGLATGEEGGTKLDRMIHSGFETGAARRPTKSPRVGRHECHPTHLLISGIRRRPTHLPLRGEPLIPPAARGVEIFVRLVFGEGNGGERGIRTLGTSRFNGFRDRPDRPLWHLSAGTGCLYERCGKIKGREPPIPAGLPLLSALTLREAWV